MTEVSWTFHLKIKSKKTPWTKEILKELDRLFESSDLISQYELRELYQSFPEMKAEAKKE